MVSAGGAACPATIQPRIVVMTMMPLSEAKTHLSQIADEVARTHDRVQITRNGREHVVLVAASDLESMEATLELLADPEARERMLRGAAEIDAGQVVTRDEMAELLDERRHREAQTGA